MKIYFPSAIIQNDKPRLMFTYTGEISLEKAMEIVNYWKTIHTILSVWVDAFNEDNNKETVFHKCYIDAFGDVGLNEKGYYENQI